MRAVDLGDGRRLVVRPAAEDDVEGIILLYEGLSVDDRYRRFFSAFQADQRFVTRLVRAPDRGGACLVAEVSPAGDGRASEIVGEADFERLADGDGELAITVDPAWRGWLGPYLLDALLEQAAAQGVPNLQADILTTNRPMLALVRSRGFATIGHDDHNVVRVTIAARRGMPSWPGPHDRPRVLVEIPGGRWHAEAEARTAGFDVVVCSGPQPGVPECPLLTGEECPLVTGADIVVFALPRDDDRGRAILDAHGRDRGGRPVLVHVRRAEEETSDLPPATTALVTPTPEQIVSALRALLGDGAGPEGPMEVDRAATKGPSTLLAPADRAHAGTRRPEDDHHHATPG